MFCSMLSGIVSGAAGCIIQVEVELRSGLPYFTMVGRLSNEAKESRHRVESALRALGCPLPPMKVTVNLSPADIRKTGTAFDLPIAAAVMAGLNYIPIQEEMNICILGELGLDGSIRGIRQCLPIILEGKRRGIHKFMVPYDDMETLGHVKDVELVPVKHLSDAAAFFRKGKILTYKIPKKDKILEKKSFDFSEIKGQVFLKRALEIAVTGRHNILLIGPPGCGKTMAVQCVSSIINRLTEEEYLEVQSLYQAAGIYRDAEDFCPPFRMPHSSVSKGALIGGGAVPKIGEITLAHKGTLVLDELSQFDAKCLEALRQPLEDRRIILNRLGRDYTMPADFLLAATINPCPCGNSFTPEACRCSMSEKRSYYHKLSGPILDRFDLVITVRQEARELDSVSESSKDIRARVLGSVAEEQQELLNTPYSYYGQVRAEDLEKICPLDSKCRQILKEERIRHHISMRGIHKMMRIAKTVARMEHKNKIEERHIIEALSLRNMDFLSEVSGYE
ncbi:YifB family Mg chelatase-like AAA ATPase [Anaerostipes sp.]|uniref:YifB family Mg chelatase-like AAA ATPase n=1 Tax=Anaerostipes sp. TaxID=1872530 RepID=UPI0025BBF9A4|nr:YifB family Mg chelatase-like AAA ATPase [Anaerostipes sp.]MBS7008063.1 YifB family Mg chelatase-like AAA ATPase [Anaerostipes sp.]